MNKLFGTDGIRKIESELTDEFCFCVGASIAQRARGERIIIGRDTRLSGERIVNAIVGGIKHETPKIEIIYVGIVPTPAVSYLTKCKNAEFGIMISASHNPHYFNGIKIFDKNGYKLSEELEEKLEQGIQKHLSSKRNFKKFAPVIPNEKLVNEYLKLIISTTNCRFDGIKVAIDAANGSNYITAIRILKKLGSKVVVINDKPNGVNINVKCGSTHIEAISQLTIKSKANIGIAFDGDGDRVIAIDENGTVLDGDKILAILGFYMKESGKLNSNTIVSTVMSNIGLWSMAKKHKINLLRTKVGDRCVLNEMLKTNCNLGGEQSGHIILLDHQKTGDGLLTAVQLISIMKNKGKKLSELGNIMESFPQILINANVATEKKDAFLEDHEIQFEIEKIASKFKDNGRIMVRSSGTESLVRIMIEGANENAITKHANELANLIVEKFGT